MITICTFLYLHSVKVDSQLLMSVSYTDTQNLGLGSPISPLIIAACASSSSSRCLLSINS